MGQPQMPFSTQAFPPGMGGAGPSSAVMCGEALPNGGFMGLQQQHQQQQEAPVLADRGQSPYSVQPGQWSMTQVTQGKLSILRTLHLLSLACVWSLLASVKTS